jgi:hypothetical protein
MPTLEVAVAVTVTVPVTVAPFVGAVICVTGSVTFVPVPDRLLLWVPALSVTMRVAVRVPDAVGVNVTLIVQLELFARLVPQLLVCPKSPALVPPTATLSPVRVDPVPLVRVKGCGELVVPMFWLL